MAARLVRGASRLLDRAYRAYVRRERDGASRLPERAYVLMCRVTCPGLLRLASRLDGETAGQEMADAGWWG
jgi:hypothetical protein